MLLYVLLSAGFLLWGACEQPTDYQTFLKDNRVQSIINGKGGSFGGNVTYEGPHEAMPELAYFHGADLRPLCEGDTVTISKGGSVSLRVTNFEDAEGNDKIGWFYGGFLLGTTFNFTANTQNFPFKISGLHHLTVERIKDEILYTTFVLIEVVD